MAYAETISLLKSTLSGNVSEMQNVYNRLKQLSHQSEFSKSLINIMLDDDVESNLKLTAALQLKNFVNLDWKKGPLCEDDKSFIRNSLLKCAFNDRYKKQKYYSVLSETISKIARDDWDCNWPDLFNLLFLNNEWILIYRICQVQSSRRLSSGTLLFKELAKNISKIVTPKLIQLQYHIMDKSICNMPWDVVNATYQLKTMNLFIQYTHLIEEKDDDFLECLHKLTESILSNSLNCIEISNEDFVYKFLKAILQFMFHHLQKNIEYFKTISTKIHFYIKSVFQKLHSFNKIDKIVIYHLNFTNCFLNNAENDLEKQYDFSFFDVLRVILMINNDKRLEKLESEPEFCLELIGIDSDDIIKHDIENLIENIFGYLIKRNVNTCLDKLLEYINVCLEKIPVLTWAEIDSLLYFIGLCMSKIPFSSLESMPDKMNYLNCTLILNNVSNELYKRNDHSNHYKLWSTFIIKRCIWMCGRWVINESSSISKDKIYKACEWCFQIMKSYKHSITIQVEVALFISHIVDGLAKTSSDFTDCNTLHDLFINPATVAIVSIIDITRSSDSHKRLIDILKELLLMTNMWNNLDLVKKCTDSIYRLWTGIKWRAAETGLLRESLLECLTTIVNSSDSSIIQDIVRELSNFVIDSFRVFNDEQLMNDSWRSIPNFDAIFNNTITFWYYLIKKSEWFIEEYQQIYVLLMDRVPMSLIREMNHEILLLLLEIIQCYFILKVQTSIEPIEFSSYTESTWKFLNQLTWNPRNEEDICICQIQLFDLWILGFCQLYKQTPKPLFQNQQFSQFLLEHFKEMFYITKTEPSNDQYPCLTNSLLTCLARLCLLDRDIIENMCSFVSNNEKDIQYRLMDGLIDRWLFRIDNLSNNLIQQCFLLASIHYLKNCFTWISTEYSRFDIASEFVMKKLEFIINSTLQVYANSDTNYLEREQHQISQLPLAGDRYLRLAYLYWNPIGQSSQIGSIIKSLIKELSDMIGSNQLDSFLNTRIDSNIRYQFLHICSSSPQQDFIPIGSNPANQQTASS